MISVKNRKFIVDVVNEIIGDCLISCKIDTSRKEVGHSYGEILEEVLVDQLSIKYPKYFKEPEKESGKGKQTRKMEDMIFIQDNEEYLVNIKFGYEKGGGQPNMVSFNRLSKKYAQNIIDSYWILVIDVKGRDAESIEAGVYLFDLYNQLEYTNFNYGTGQVMLKEKEFFTNFDPDDYSVPKRKDVIEKMIIMNEESYIRHIEKKKKQNSKLNRMLADAI